MIKIKPSDAILRSAQGSTSCFYETVDWWMAYEWFCRELMKFQPTNTKHELLNATSSINNGRFYTCWSIEQPLHRLAYLLKGGWFLSTRKEFLEYLEIKTWSDLDKTISIHGLRPKIFPRPSWFKMGGRTFKRGQNSSHPKARYVYNFGLRFVSYRRLWRAIIEYGYPHDSSSWLFELEQKKKEKLDSFAVRIDQWINKYLWPDNDPKLRIQRERTRELKYAAAKELFWDDVTYRCEDAIADSLYRKNDISIHSTKIHLNRSRTATLMRWAKK